MCTQAALFLGAARPQQSMSGADLAVIRNLVMAYCSGFKAPVTGSLWINCYIHFFRIDIELEGYASSI